MSIFLGHPVYTNLAIALPSPAQTAILPADGSICLPLVWLVTSLCDITRGWAVPGDKNGKQNESDEFSTDFSILIPLFHHVYVWTPDLTEILKKNKKNLVADDAVERGETTRCV